ncbi:MAG: DoxX family protein [Bacteroidetes bacterium]|nr:DoxX family protein [Bacteroidota bacterium]
MMNTIVWIIQGLLAAFFLMAGTGKISKSTEEHIKERHILPGQSAMPIRLLGVAELLGCIGIIMPWAMGICRVLTPIAALGFATVMIGAIAIQARRRDYTMLAVPVVLLVFCGIVAWYRFSYLIDAIP